MEEPAGAGITGAAVGDVGEPDGFFWSSSEDSKEVCPVCLRGRPRDSRLEAALAAALCKRKEQNFNFPYCPNIINYQLQLNFDLNVKPLFEIKLNLGTISSKKNSLHEASGS